MHDEFVDPNWHVILIHYPLGLLGVGLGIEILSFFWRRSSVRLAGRWMLLIGALATIPTAAVGLYALRDVVAPGPIADETWRQVTARSPWNAEQWEQMTDHMWTALGGTAVAVLAAFVWLACSDRGRQRLYWPALILMIAALSLVGAAAWHGGEGVYRHGVAVKAEAGEEHPSAHIPAASVVMPLAPTSSGPATEPAGREMMAAPQMSREAAPEHLIRLRHELPKDVKFYIPPLELHLFLAGSTIAIALGAFGVTLRRWAIMRTPMVPPVPSVAAVDLPEHRLRPDLPNRPSPSVDPSPGVTPIPQIFPARLWLWALIFGVATAAAGLWMTGDWSLSALLGPIRDRSTMQQNQRLFGHVAVGSSIALLLLIGAILTRLAKRHRPLTVLVMLLLLIAVAGQAWLGVLLLFDSSAGSVMRFNS